MSYAKALQKTKPYGPSQQTRVYAYAHSVRALWGDIDEYHPDDGDYKTFFDASAAARKRQMEESKEKENTRTPQQVDDDQERIREKALAREQRQKQAKAMALLREWSRIKVKSIRAVTNRASFRKACKCGCGRLVHSNPKTSDFCCNWCGKHDGRRGHGPACEAISSTTFQLA